MTYNSQNRYTKEQVSKNIPPLNKNPNVVLAKTGIMTVKGVMETFNLRQARTVINQLIYGRVKAWKLDTPIGDKGGTWLIDAQSAYDFWYQGDKSNGNSQTTHDNS